MLPVSTVLSSKTPYKIEQSSNIQSRNKKHHRTVFYYNNKKKIVSFNNSLNTKEKKEVKAHSIYISLYSAKNLTIWKTNFTSKLNRTRIVTFGNKINLKGKTILFLFPALYTSTLHGQPKRNQDLCPFDQRWLLFWNDIYQQLI